MCFVRSASDLDDTIEDIDVREHCAVLGWWRPRWFEAHVLHLYSHDFRKSLVRTDIVRQEALGIEVMQPGGGRCQPRLHIGWKVVGRRCDGNCIDTPVQEVQGRWRHGGPSGCTLSCSC